MFIHFTSAQAGSESVSDRPNFTDPEGKQVMSPAPRLPSVMASSVMEKVQASADKDEYIENQMKVADELEKSEVPMQNSNFALPGEHEIFTEETIGYVEKQYSNGSHHEQYAEAHRISKRQCVKSASGFPYQAGQKFMSNTWGTA